MGIFKFSSKDKSGNRQVRFAFIDGIDNLFPVNRETVDVTIDRSKGKLIIESCLSKKRVAYLALDKVTDVRDMTDVQIQEVEKSVIGRAVVGGLLMGPLGSIIGGMSGLSGKKKVKSKHHFVIITYKSDGIERQIVLEIVGASMGWPEFVSELPKDPNSPFAKIQITGPVEL